MIESICDTIKKLPHAEGFQNASPIWGLMRKPIDNNWSNSVTSFVNSSTAVNTKWNIIGTKFERRLFIDYIEHELIGPNKNDYNHRCIHESKGSMIRFQNLMSCYWWGDGSGALGRVNQLLDAGSTIEFVNKGDAVKFEQGDAIEFATVKSGGAVIALSQRTVTSISENSGRIGLNATVTGTANPLDYVYIQGTYDQVFKGFFSWCPYTSTEAATPLFGVNRAARVDRLGGRRKFIPVGGDPYSALLEVMSTASKAGSDFDCIAIHENTYEELSASLHNRQVGQIVHQSPYNGVNRSEMLKMMASDSIIDTKGILIPNPRTGKDVYIYVDKYLTRPESTEDQDRHYVAFKMDDWRMFIDKSGMSWKRETQEQLKMFYGINLGQFVTRNTNNNVIVGPAVIE